MSKRRRAGSLPRYTEDDSLDSFEASTSSGPTTQKRRKLFDPIEICQQLLEILRNHKKEDGTLLSESFIRVPKRRQEPAYYDVVSNPIDLIKVQQKLKMDEYEDVEDLQNDIELMVNNAKSFYKRNTQEFKDAVEMMDLFITNRNKLLNIEDEPPSKKSVTNNRQTSVQKNSTVKRSLPKSDRTPLKSDHTPVKYERTVTRSDRGLSKSERNSLSRHERSLARSERNVVSSDSRTSLNCDDSASDISDDSCPFEELLAAVMGAKDEHKKLLYPAFQLLPSRKKYPDYYEVVEQPVDLKIVTNKVQNNKYKFLFELEKDLLLMCKNACLYNEPGSHIYKQAKVLRKFVQEKRIEIDTRRGTLPIMATPAPRNNVNQNSTKNSATKTSLNASKASLNASKTSLSPSKTSLSASKTSLNSSKTSLNSNSRHNSSNSIKHSRSPSLNRSHTTPNSHRHSTFNSSKHSLSSVRDRLSSSVNRNSVHRRGVSPKFYKNHRISSTPSPISNTFKLKHKKIRSGSIGSLTAKNHDSDADIDADSGAAVDLNNPHWKLFEMVRTATGSNGMRMSEPFWKLPSRRFYPDYYREIKNPICLGQIRRKLVKKGYGTLSEVAGDLTIMFENAKKYNIPTSKLYKDAVKLQKLMQTKVQELLDVDQLFTEKEVVRRKPGPKPKNLSPGSAPRGRPPKDTTALKKRLHMLAKYMLDYTTEDGRKPMLAFIEKPSKKLYPEYYEVIAEPIDFLEIEAKIKAEQYSCEADLVKDFKLMFSNCRQFNEENSPIHEDANLLEKYLLNKVAQLKPVNVTPDKPKRERIVLKPNFSNRYKPRRILSPLEKTLKTLYEAVRYYRDPKEGRQLSQTFMKLPSKLEYPDYYEVISNPIDMERISQKIRASDYENLEELVADFVLLFDNACRYNEPDSQLYKDALVLQRFLFQTKMQLKDDENTVPDVALVVQDIFLSLFTNVYNYQDDDGRCYSDSMADLPEHDEIDGKKVRAVSLDLIKRRLDKGLYKRLDVFQEDFFNCMERARRVSRTDSQVFEDAIELQFYFIKQRDELCKNGELLSSPALMYTEVELRASIDDVRAEKAMKESLDDDTETRCSEDSILKEIINVNEENSNGNSKESSDKEEEATVNNKKPTEAPLTLDNEGDEDNNSKDANNVDKVSEDKEKPIKDSNKETSDETGPSETKEPSESENKQPIVENSTGKETNAVEETNGCADGASMTCNDRTFRVGEFVYLDAKEKGCEPHILCIERLWENGGQQMMYGNYFLRPDETYHVKTRKFLEREVFKSDSYVAVPLQEVKKKCCVVNVKHYFTMKPEGFDDNDVYVCESRYRTRLRFFKKIKIYPESGAVKLIPRETPLKLKRVMSVFRERIEKHKDELQELEELEKLVEKEKPNIVAYNNMEIDDGNTYYEQFNTVCSGVIKTGDFVYVVADGGKQIISQIDSIWETKDGKCYFRGPWFIYPADIPHNPTRMFYKNEVFLSSLEDASPIVSIIGKCHVLELNDWVVYRPTEIPETDVYICSSMYDEINRQVKKLPPGGLKKYTHSLTVTDDEIYFFNRVLHPPKKSNKNKVVTGYILYSREVRKQVVQNNPESTFGDISRIVGSEWKSLPQGEKQHWEEKASKLNEETKALLLLEQEACGSPAPPQVPPPPPVDQVFECLWDNCDYQFEEVSDLIDHCIKDKESQGHVQAFYQENAGMEFNCFWRNCSRAKKNVQPFPNITRLIRHVRDMHINKGNGRSVPPENRSKNFKPSSKPAAVNRPTSSATPNALSSSNVLSPNAQKPQEPMFISVPPRPQRVLHSEAYIKYIEGLAVENKHVTSWERTLQATQENTPAPEPDMEKLKHVTAWLGRKADQHDNVVAALWALRNQLLKDTLSLHKTL